MQTQEWEALVHRYLAAYNAFDVDAMCALLSPDVRFEHHAGGRLAVETTGMAAFRQLAEQSLALFSDREQRITRIEADERGLTAGIAFRGTLRADLPEGPAAGSVLEMAGSSRFAFQSGAIAAIIDRA